MSGASLPTPDDAFVKWFNKVLIPDEWGKSSDAVVGLVLGLGVMS